MSKTSAEDVFAEALVTTKGQIVVPVRIRKKLGIHPGTRVRFVERDGEVIFQPVTVELIRSLAGALRSQTSVGAELLQERAKDRAREKKKHARVGPR